MKRTHPPLLLALALIAGSAVAQNPPLLRAPLQAPAGTPGIQPNPIMVPRANPVPQGSPQLMRRPDQEQRLRESLEQRDAPIPVLDQQLQRNTKGLGTGTGNP
ncbi:hypothetical protein [Metapseudomonas resinovorans]|uniref:Uncharacterized protein n=1 Tax=Metapseudomonas resinovorans NBRC 106553 TaxID=1245471 RepID=S6API4_METRE|nr:hypothetical protein [Pseudomonas resinovorans]BAN47583.1 hypothetical protein PCA10_18510 [Pseudomonas resinovorans NBRC 106553]